MMRLEMDFLRHGYPFIGVKLDSTRARAPQPPRWCVTPEQKHIIKLVTEYRASYLHNQ